MADNALVQVRIDPEIRDKASEVLAEWGMTVSEVVRILLTRTANEGVVPLEIVSNDEDYDTWFRAKVQEALDDPRPPIPDEEVRAHFARRIADLQAKAAKAGKP
jgi:DNA-damage-inducible protein J